MPTTFMTAKGLSGSLLTTSSLTAKGPSSRPDSFTGPLHSPLLPGLRRTGKRVMAIPSPCIRFICRSLLPVLLTMKPSSAFSPTVPKSTVAGLSVIDGASFKSDAPGPMASGTTLALNSTSATAGSEAVESAMISMG